MSVVEQETMDLASQIVGDAVRGGFEKWKTLMDNIAEVEGLDQGELSPLSLAE